MSTQPQDSGFPEKLSLGIVLDFGRMEAEAILNEHRSAQSMLDNSFPYRKGIIAIQCLWRVAGDKLIDPQIAPRDTYMICGLDAPIIDFCNALRINHLAPKGTSFLLN